MEKASKSLDLSIGQRIRAVRAGNGLSLDKLAEISGVSRAMISKIERGDASATAALLARLCAGLGINLSALFLSSQEDDRPLSRRALQVSWQDPDSGYVRRTVSPSGTASPIELTDVTMPPGKRVAFDTPWILRRIDQQIYLLEGTLEMTIGKAVHQLAAGDCLHMRCDEPIAYHNKGKTSARYIVALTFPGGLS